MTEKMLTIGSRAQVWHKTAKKTSGGLTHNDLMMNKSGRIVSKAKHNTAKKEQRLLKHGYGTKKGKFGFVKVGSRKNRKGSKKMRGGIYLGGSGMGELSPADSNASYMIKDVVAQPETPLTRALVGGAKMRGGFKMRGGAKMRGGSAYGSGLYPSDVNASYMIKDVVPQQFSPLDRALVGGSKMRGGVVRRGGTTSRVVRGGTVKNSHLAPMDINDPLARALGA